MSKITVLTTTFAKYDSGPLDICRDKGHEVVLNPHNRKVEPSEIIALSKDAVGIIAGTENFSEEVLLKLPELKIISRCGVGLDTIDLNAAKRLNIEIRNTPDGPTLAVAEFTIGLMLSLIRRISFMDQELRSGLWSKNMGNLLYGKCVGIIGFGRIGQKVAQLLDAFGSDVVYHDPFIKDKISSYPNLGLNELLKKSDIVSLHLAASKENSMMIGADEFSLMKKDAFLINCSRGGIVDEAALCVALDKNNLAGAGCDVFSKEPYNGGLTQFRNVILTPHVGSYAKEARVQMENQAVNNLLTGLAEIA